MSTRARVRDLATTADGRLVVRVRCSCGDEHRLVTTQQAESVERVLDLLALIAPCSPEPLEVLDPAGWLEAAADLRRRLRWQATTKGATP